MAVIDHLVIAARDLDSGARWLEERLGVPLVPGGAHVLMGTHNRLLRLGGGERLYLELIAIDPAATPPRRPRWFSLDDPTLQARLAERPYLIHWVARSDELAREATPAHGEIMAMQRGDFRWRITVPADGCLPDGGRQPTLIQWDVPFHPAERLPESGCTLLAFDTSHPGRLVATLETPRGRVALV
jgi:hypothetical protein